MTTLEIQASTAGPVRMPAVIRESRIQTAQRSSTVVDCPAYAWDESDKAALLDLWNTFGRTFVDSYEQQLTATAHELIVDFLRAEWSARGFDVVFVLSKSAFESGDAPGPDGLQYAMPDNDTYHQVWQAAADAITDQALVDKARLGHVFQMRTDLQRHRDALHHRLDELARDDMCLRAEQQLDGLRAAVDAAVTRAQLIEISAQVDALVTPIPA